ncbi:MAG: polysaccharide deacetylase family protein [Huintestinicola sp.]
MIWAITSAVLFSSCMTAEPETESEGVDYIAVYRQISGSDDVEEENVDTPNAADLPGYNAYNYLDHAVFVGDNICGGLSEYGFLRDGQVLADENFSSEISDDFFDGADFEESPYIYLWYGGRYVFSCESTEEYAEEILSSAECIRERFPESMVIILSVSPAAAEKGGSEDIKAANKAVKQAVRDCDDINIRYMDVWSVLSDSDGYLLSVYDKGDGASLSSAGCRKLLSFIQENRFYNEAAGDEKYKYIYKDMYIARPEYQVSEGKIAYLTFDDGPSKYTEQILDILDDNDIKATFFITGWCIDGKEDILADIAARGHTIGVHSYSHDYDEIYADVTSFLDDYNKVYNRIYDVTGVKPWAFRFPGGSYNNFNKTTADSIIAEMNRRGFTYYDWNAATADASNSSDYYSCMEYLENSLYSDHSVVLMHDSLELTTEYLQDAIDYIRSEGYTFETIENADPVQF